jgi:four helix bundle protein
LRIFLFAARGEAQEMQGHLGSAYITRCISKDELHELQARYKEVAKMLSGLARHLRRENRKFRA